MGDGRPALTAVVDGRLHDFSCFAASRTNAEIFRAAFLHHLSTNERLSSRRSTDGTSFSLMKMFLRFLDDRTRQGKPASLDLLCLTEYTNFLEANYSQLTATTARNVAVKVCRFAIEKGLAQDFQIPRGKSIREAYNFTERGRTLADHLSTGSGSHVERNRILLSTLKSFCWQRGVRAHARLLYGFNILNNMASPKGRKLLPGLKFPSGESELICAAIHDIVVRSSERSRSPTSPFDLVSRYAVRDVFREHSKMFCAAGLSREDLTEFLIPSHRLHGFFMPLFAMLKINPSAIQELTLDMLVDLPGLPGHKAIKWAKGRANTELMTEPISEESPEGKRIIQAWNMLTDVGNLVRSYAAIADRDRLFLFYSPHVFLGRQPGCYPELAHRAMSALDEAVAQDTDPRHESLRNLDCRISLKLIRNTASVIEWHTNGGASAQRSLRHRSRTTTDIYVLDDYAKAKLDDEIEDAQQSLLEHLTSKPQLLPNDADRIEREFGLSNDTARALVADDLNAGFGISLVDENAYVIDTPLNCLRMTTWLQRIELSKERLMDENPNRWASYWRYQAELFREALTDFPRRTVEAARVLGNEVTLSFPEPH